MKGRMLATLGGLVFVVSLVLGIADGPQARNPDEVVVVNQVERPVPTAAQGTTRVAGRVQAFGTAREPLFVTPALVFENFFVHNVSLTLDGILGETPLFVVPPDRHLVIKHVLGQVSFPADETLDMGLRFFYKSSLAHLDVPYQPVAQANPLFLGSVSLSGLNVVAQAGLPVSFLFLRVGTDGGTLSVKLTILGEYLPF